MTPLGTASPSGSSEYPSDRRARDRWILAQRPARLPVSADQPHGYFLEAEPNAAGTVLQTATILLTNRECPWRCLMCDLWKTTLTETVPVGAVPQQIDYALGQLLPDPGPGRNGPSPGPVPAPRQIKLYNGGSFFDARAIPFVDYPAIAQRVARFERVIVECHPAVVGDACLRFRDFLAAAAAQAGAANTPQLEVAMGLETVHPEVLEKLNKRMTVEQFARAADFLATHGIALRVFVLVKPPFLDEAEALCWAERSVDFAFNAGASAVSLIPVRAGNGAMEALQASGDFAPPKLLTLERAHSYGLGLHRGRVFADLWDLEMFSDCPACFPARLWRLRRMNLEQQLLEPVQCSACGPAQAASPRESAPKPDEPARC